MVGDVKRVLGSAGFVVAAIKNWSCWRSVKPAVDLSPPLRPQLMFEALNWIKFLLSMDFGSQH